MTNSFDLITHPDQIQPDFAFYSIFLTAGAVLVVLTAIAARQRWRIHKNLLFFTPVWVILSIVLLALDARDTLQVRSLVKQGDIHTVEGCLSSFHSGLAEGSKTSSGDERWSVASEDFAYGAGEVRPGYHLVEENEGIVHATSRVRVSFVLSPYYGRKEIVRLIVLRPSCPSAPDRNQTSGS
ncbi:hypothetical protein [Sphingomonas sp. R86520]|uniref:hypothetical protein n=1 Tax=Sphingomonas sp. R86520 TaxID=3093859 RepID=UPI0036D29C9A